MNILITGGCGFIGINLINRLLKNKNNKILNIDCLTQSSMPEWLKKYRSNSKYQFKKINLYNKKKLRKTFFDFKPNIVFHLAAESHVDTSIDNPSIFVDSNIVGTFNLLSVGKEYWEKIQSSKFLFIHVSTDEVYGSLNKGEKAFTESNAYLPNSPYAASKAASDHLVRSWNMTYNFPSIITHCSNNYGPYQFPEKLVPVVISKVLNKKRIPVYGDGKNIREWIYVEDHVRALILISKKGKIGNVYNIGSDEELSNISLIKKITKIIDDKNKKNYKSFDLIHFIEDRKGHDFRYAINSKKIHKELNFKIQNSFDQGMNKTINWYLDNKKWLLKKN